MIEFKIVHIYLSWFLLFILAFVFEHKYFHLEKTTKDKKLRRKYSSYWHACTAVMFVLIGVSFGDAVYWHLHDSLNVWTWLFLVGRLCFLFLSIAWILFDGWLNVIVGWGYWWFVGSTAWLDKLFKKPVYQFIAKFVLLIISILLLI